MRYLPGILAMATIVVASNILVQHLLGQWLTYGAFTYPLAFLVNDTTNRLQGARAARIVVVSGFFVGVICSLIGSQIEGEFGPLVSFRVALASGLAFLAGQLIDISVFNRLRNRVRWWPAPLAATLIGSVLDTCVFFTIAFAVSLSFLEPGNDVTWANETLPLLGLGPAAPLWISLAAADLCVKLVLGIFALLPFRAMVWRFSPRIA
ncbi:VUT family protein [Rhodobacter capsulatus]|uniref:Probable queuosine precursor transporter n=1 Tax=Rhodobacter capsulatus TaxID=1061 RepID=A0A4U1K231_RHOCA|nr:queuosine precursor transporter [Rhodobacter capsulatus]TKD26058.1 VUT family protein [Rhodobacter capsulatus]